MLRVRNFETDDLYEVVHLANRALDESYDGGLFLQLGDLYPDGFIVAEEVGPTLTPPSREPGGEGDGGSIVGFILGVVERAYEARVLILAVDADHRRQGIGSRLLRLFLERFARNGIRRVNLEVRVSNKPAIRFYEDMGFDRQKVIEDYYKDGEDAYLMSRTL